MRRLRMLAFLLLCLAPQASGVVIVDLDRDGMPDLCIASVETDRATGTLQRVRWTSQGSDDAFVLVDASSLRSMGFDLSDATGTPLSGLVMCRAGLTLQEPGGTMSVITDGWQLLAALDSNSDSHVDASDPAGSALYLHKDDDCDGVLDASEVSDMSALSSLPVSSSSSTLDGCGNLRAPATAASSLGLPLECADILLASPPIVDFGGLHHIGMGAASLDLFNGNVVIGNIGSQGSDGVEVRLGNAGGVSLSFHQWTWSQSSRLALCSDCDDMDTAVESSVSLSGGVYHVTLRLRPHDSFGGGGGGGSGGSVSSFHVEARDAFGNLITREDVSSLDEILLNQAPKKGNVEFEWKVEEGESKTASDYPGRLLPEMVWTLDSNTIVTLPSHGALAQCVELRCRVTDDSVSSSSIATQCEVRLLASGQAPVADLSLSPPALRHFRHDVVALGDALLRADDGEDQDCDGDCDDQDCDDGVASTESSLALENLGSSGNDGARVLVLPHVFEQKMRLSCPDGACADAGGSSFTFGGTFDVQGVAHELTHVVQVTSPRVLELSWDNSALATSSTLECYDGDELVFSTPLVTSSVSIDGGNNQNWDFGGMGLRSSLAGEYAFTLQMTEPSSFQLGSLAVEDVLCDAIVVRYQLSDSSADLVDVSLRVASPTLCSVDIDGLPNSRVIPLHGLPPGEPVFARAAERADIGTLRSGILGSSSAPLRMSNIGSSGNDGVSFDLSSLSSPVRRMHTIWGELGPPSLNPTATLTLSSACALSAGGVRRFRGGGLILHSQSSRCVCRPSFAEVGATQVRVVAIQNGEVVANQVIADGDVAFESSSWPDGGGYEPVGTTPGLWLSTGGSISLTIYGNFKAPQIVTADVVQMVPEDATTSVASLDSWTVQASNLPYLDFSTLSAEQPSIPVAVALRGFSADSESEGVLLSWDVRMDPGDLLGFRVHRRSGTENRVLHQGMLPANQRTFLDREARPEVAYSYRLELVMKQGEAVLSEEIGAQTPRAILSLSPNMPNPFNPKTTIFYSLPQQGRVNLSIFDLSGRLVATLIDAEMPAGSASVQWLGVDDRGATVASGSYFYRLRTEHGELAHKLTLLK